MAKRRDGRVPAARSVDATAGVGRCPGEVETADGRLRAPETPRRAEHELLVQGRGAGVERTPAEVGVRRLHRPGRLDVSAAAQVEEPRRHLLHAPLQPLGLFRHEVVVMGQLPGEVRVGPHRLGPRGGAGGVRRRHLAEEDEGGARHPADSEVSGDVDQPVVVHAEVHRAGTAGPGRRPGDRGVERPVDLEGGVVPLEESHVVEQPGRQVVCGDELARTASVRGRRRGCRAAPGPWCRRPGAHRRRGRRSPPPRSPRRRSAPALRGTPPGAAVPWRASRRLPPARGSRRPGRASRAASRRARCLRCRVRRHCASHCPTTGSGPPRCRTAPHRGDAPRAARAG